MGRVLGGAATAPGSKRKKSALRRALLIAAGVLLLAGALTAGALRYARTRPFSTEQVAAQVRPSVVGVVQYRKDMLREAGEGSGIILSANGLIATNCHVVSGASRLVVVCADGKRYEAKLVGADARTDLAVVRIAAAHLRAARLGDSDGCRVGEQVVAIGNPSGLQLAGSVTKGIISAVNRDIDVGNGPMNLLQTDAAINPGNSGGALVDMNGRVIGINSAKIAQVGFEGIGFSIPVSTARPVLESLIRYGYVKGRVKFGITCRAIDALTARAENLPAGLYVASVEAGGSAASHGVKPGDIITALDGAATPTAEALIRERDQHRPGDIVFLTLYRPSTFGMVAAPVTLQEDRGTNAVQANNW